MTKRNVLAGVLYTTFKKQPSGRVQIYKVVGKGKGKPMYAMKVYGGMEF
jgi:hypothetical protein